MSNQARFDSWTSHYYMGQKSLPQLHKIDTSMMWETSLYNSNYKWLSYNLWFIFTYYYKYNLYSMNQKNLELNNFFLNQNYLVNIRFNKYSRLKSYNIRFSYFIELYCLEYYNYLLLINIFFLTNLSFFKDSKQLNLENKKKLKNFFI